MFMSTHSSVVAEVFSFCVKYGIETRHRALCFYLKKHRGPNVSEYERSKFKELREKAIAAFAEFERESANDIETRSLSDDEFFERCITPIWHDDDFGQPDLRTARQKVIDGDEP